MSVTPPPRKVLTLTPPEAEDEPPRRELVRETWQVHSALFTTGRARRAGGKAWGRVEVVSWSESQQHWVCTLNCAPWKAFFPEGTRWKRIPGRKVATRGVRR